MGLFDFFKKSSANEKHNTDNGLPGPTFFEGLTEHIDHPKDLHDYEWRRKLKSSSGQTKFKIKYYGQPHEEYPKLIVRTSTAPQLVVAVDVVSGEEIVVFDGCKFGYDAIFCDTYTDEQIRNRPIEHTYKDGAGYTSFEVILSAYYQGDVDGEFLDEVDDAGFIVLPDGSRVEFEKVKRNAFDVFQVLLVNERGERVEIVSEELA